MHWKDKQLEQRKQERAEQKRQGRIERMRVLVSLQSLRTECAARRKKQPQGPPFCGNTYPIVAECKALVGTFNPAKPGCMTQRATRRVALQAEGITATFVLCDDCTDLLRKNARAYGLKFSSHELSTVKAANTVTLAFFDDGERFGFGNGRYEIRAPYTELAGVRFAGPWALYDLDQKDEISLVQDPDTNDYVFGQSLAETVGWSERVLGIEIALEGSEAVLDKYPPDPPYTGDDVDAYESRWDVFFETGSVKTIRKTTRRIDSIGILWAAFERAERGLSTSTLKERRAIILRRIRQLEKAA